MINIEVKKSQIDQVILMTKGIKQGYPKVMSRSINQALSTAKTQAALRIGNEINLKAARIKEDLEAKKASFSNVSGRLRAASKPPTLISYGAKELADGGVSVKIFKSSAPKRIKRAFIALGRGTSQVFRRRWAIKNKLSANSYSGMQRRVRKYTGKYRNPVFVEYGPRPSAILQQSKVLDAVTAQATHVLEQNIERELDKVLQGY
jgi:hypothetical protein